MVLPACQGLVPQLRQSVQQPARGLDPFWPFMVMASRRGLVLGLIADRIPFPASRLGLFHNRIWFPLLHSAPAEFPLLELDGLHLWRPLEMIPSSSILLVFFHLQGLAVSQLLLKNSDKIVQIRWLLVNPIQVGSDTIAAFLLWYLFSSKYLAS
jgi:hypothetical protein